MSQDNSNRSDDDADTIMMNHERPLDSLMPELAESRAPFRIEPLHQRVLEVETDDGHEWLLACWRNPGGLPAFHKALKALCEATLLAHLSQPARRGGAALAKRFESMRLMVFDTFDGELRAAVKPFGMSLAMYQPERYVERMSVLRDEASLMGWGSLMDPKSVWAARVAHSPGEERLLTIQNKLAEALKEKYWGSEPGGPSKAMAEHLKASFPQAAVAPTPEGLDMLETLLVSHETEVIRWIPPLLFQALCDFVGVVIQHHYDVEVLWAVCEEDDLGLCPPPLFRLARPGGKVEHFPVGLFVLRWCVMPIQAGESVPTLSAWIEGEFGS